MEAAEDADPRGKRDPRDFALWKGRKKESEPETAAWPSPWGPRPSRLAHRVLGDGAEVPRRGLRHPRRRRRPALPAPRERAGPVPGGRPPVRVVLDAQRLDHHRRREDEQVARQRAVDPGRARRRCARSTCASTWSPRTTARTSSSPSRRSTRPPPGSPGSSTSSSRARDLLGEVEPGTWCAEFETAMDDDLGTPAAVAAIYDVVREGNKLLAAGPSDALRGAASSVRGDARRARARPVRPALVDRPARPRARRSSPPPSTRSSPRCSSSGPRRARRRTSRRPTRSVTSSRRRGSTSRTPPRVRSGLCDQPTDGPATEGHLMAGNSSRRGAIKKTGKGNPTAGSGGRVKRGLEGRGPTPKAKDREGHKAYKERQRAEKTAAKKPRRPVEDRRHRVDRRAQLGGRGAAREHAGHRGLRRRGRRARRPAARGVQDRRRARHLAARGGAATSSTG